MTLGCSHIANARVFNKTRLLTLVQTVMFAIILLAQTSIALAQGETRGHSANSSGLPWRFTYDNRVNSERFPLLANNTPLLAGLLESLLSNQREASSSFASPASIAGIEGITQVHIVITEAVSATKDNPLFQIDCYTRGSNPVPLGRLYLRLTAIPFYSDSKEATQPILQYVGGAISNDLKSAQFFLKFDPQQARSLPRFSPILGGLYYNEQIPFGDENPPLTFMWYADTRQSDVEFTTASEVADKLVYFRGVAAPLKVHVFLEYVRYLSVQPIALYNYRMNLAETLVRLDDRSDVPALLDIRFTGQNAVVNVVDHHRIQLLKPLVGFEQIENVFVSQKHSGIDLTSEDIHQVIETAVALELYEALYGLWLLVRSHRQVLVEEQRDRIDAIEEAIHWSLNQGSHELSTLFYRRGILTFLAPFRWRNLDLAARDSIIGDLEPNMQGLLTAAMIAPNHGFSNQQHSTKQAAARLLAKLPQLEIRELHSARGDGTPLIFDIDVATQILEENDAILRRGVAPEGRWAFVPVGNWQEVDSGRAPPALRGFTDWRHLLDQGFTGSQLTTVRFCWLTSSDVMTYLADNSSGSFQIRSDFTIATERMSGRSIMTPGALFRMPLAVVIAAAQRLRNKTSDTGHQLNTLDLPNLVEQRRTTETVSAIYPRTVTVGGDRPHARHSWYQMNAGNVIANDLERPSYYANRRIYQAMQVLGQSVRYILSYHHDAQGTVERIMQQLPPDSIWRYRSSNEEDNVEVDIFREGAINTALHELMELVFRNATSEADAIEYITNFMQGANISPVVMALLLAYCDNTSLIDYPEVLGDIETEENITRVSLIHYLIATDSRAAAVFHDNVGDSIVELIKERMPLATLPPLRLVTELDFVERALHEILSELLPSDASSATMASDFASRLHVPGLSLTSRIASLHRHVQEGEPAEREEARNTLHRAIFSDEIGAILLFGEPTTIAQMALLLRSRLRVKDSVVQLGLRPLWDTREVYGDFIASTEPLLDVVAEDLRGSARKQLQLLRQDFFGTSLPVNVTWAHVDSLHDLSSTLSWQAALAVDQPLRKQELEKLSAELFDIAVDLSHHVHTEAPPQASSTIEMLTHLSQTPRAVMGIEVPADVVMKGLSTLDKIALEATTHPAANALSYRVRRALPTGR